VLTCYTGAAGKVEVEIEDRFFRWRRAASYGTGGLVRAGLTYSCSAIGKVWILRVIPLAIHLVFAQLVSRYDTSGAMSVSVDNGLYSWGNLRMSNPGRYIK